MKKIFLICCILLTSINVGAQETNCVFPTITYQSFEFDNLYNSFYPNTAATIHFTGNQDDNPKTIADLHAQLSLNIPEEYSIQYYTDTIPLSFSDKVKYNWAYHFVLIHKTLNCRSKYYGVFVVDYLDANRSFPDLKAGSDFIFCKSSKPTLADIKMTWNSAVRYRKMVALKIYSSSDKKEIIATGYFDNSKSDITLSTTNFSGNKTAIIDGQKIYITVSFTETLANEDILIDESDVRLYNIVIIDDTQIPTYTTKIDTRDNSTILIVNPLSKTNNNVNISYNVFLDGEKLYPINYSDNEFKLHKSGTYTIQASQEYSNLYNSISNTNCKNPSTVYKNENTQETSPTLDASHFDYNNKTNIYPNPAQDVLNIDANVLQATITSTSGQLILNTDKKAIDISSLPKGLYFITIKTENGIINSKFVKE